MYSWGTGFGYAFDDEGNLGGLAQVEGLSSALLFIFSGDAGPSGRPLALASFLLNAPSWPADHVDFLRTNVLVHLLNAVLLMWFALRLQRYLPWNIHRPEYFALFVGLLWAISPVLISANLMIVQRMTSLSATFCLVGLIAFIIGRQNLGLHRARSLIVMSAGISVGTVLSVLCKENGILLPLFALVTEVTLIAHRKGCSGEPVARFPRWWFVLFLLVPSVFVGGYLTYAGWQTGGVYAGRDFTLVERVLTEARILFVYLWQIVLPTRSGLGPYHDDYIASTSLFDPLVTIVAVAGWLTLLVAALRLRSGRWCLFSFAVLWFLAGHLIESTVIGLELYFEHRNYMPAMGIIFGLVALLWHPALSASFRYLGLAMLLGFQLFIFKETILVWGNPGLASGLWYAEHPESLRALQTHLAYVRDSSSPEQIIALVDAAPERLASKSEYQVFRLSVHCQLMNLEDGAMDAVTKRVESSFLRSAPKTPTAQELIAIGEKMSRGECTGIAEDAYMRLLEAVASSRQAGSRAKSLAHEGLGDWYVRLRIIDQAMFHFEAAFDLSPTLRVAAKMVAVLVSAGLYDAAEDVVADTRSHIPQRPFVAQAWTRNLNELTEAIGVSRNKFAHTLEKKSQ